MRGFFYFFIATLVLGSFAYYNLPKNKVFQFEIPKIPISSTKTLEKNDIPPPKNTTSIHSSTLAKLDDKRILSAYFAGSREGAKDVAIWGNIFVNKQWGEAFEILNRQRLMQDSKEYIKKLGNPVLYQLDNTLHLFVVGVSLGGWATSKIYHYTAISNAETLSFQFQKALHLSPFLNLSNLVRTQPIEITFSNQEKGFILPIYHELANKYALLLVFDAKGDMLQIVKPNNAYGLLQPSLTALTPTNALLAFRADRNANSILYTQECDNGLQCKPLIKTNLINEDNSLNLFGLNQQIYLVYNTRNGERNRGKLSIAKMQTQEKFLKLFDMDRSFVGEVSYPTTIIIGDKIHISYTVDRKFIRHLMLDTSYFGE